MANLETLEMKISANAQSASQGIGQLVGSLRSLNKGVGSSVSALTRLNAQLEKLTGYKGIRLRGLENIASSKGTRQVERTAKAFNETAEATKKIAEAQKATQNYNPKWARSEEEWEQQVALRNKYYGEEFKQSSAEWKQAQDNAQKVMEQQAFLKRMQGFNPKASVMKGYDYFSSNKKEWDSSMYGPKQLEKQATAFEKFKAAVGKVKDIQNPLKNAGGALARFGSQVGSIAKTMLIRQALRSVISGAKEGLRNFYEYSKRIGNGYASVLDQMASTAGTAKNQLGVALGTALAAVIPILNAIASAAISALNALSQLFALLTGRGTWTKATAGAESFGKAVGGGGSALKEMLADFDELNVIASQGGGGGGGGALDYANMFEEMAEFDSRIKGLVEWLENHIPIVNAAVARLAAALLGLSGAGITISIGLALAFSGGYDMGKNGVNATNLLETIGGVIATALGGAWLGAGTVVGAGMGGVIGLTVGLMVTVAGIYIGTLDSLYGDIHKSMEEIKQDIEKYFNIDEAKINVINVRLANIREAEEAVEKALGQMNVDFNLDLSNKYGSANVQRLYESVKDVIETVNNLIEFRKEQIKVGLEITTQFDDPKSVINFSSDQWNKLDAYVKNLGKQIGDILSDGVVSGIDEQTMLTSLQEKLNRVTNAILNGEQKGSFAAGVSLSGAGFREQLANGAFDRSTFTNYLRAYQGQYSDLKNVAEANASATKQALGSLYYGMLESGDFTQAELDEAWSNYTNFDVAKDVADKMKVWAADGLELFRQDMVGGFGTVLSSEFASNLMKIEFTRISKSIEDAARNNDWETVGRTIQNGLQKALSEATGIDEQLLIDVQNILGITGWDMMTADLKAKYYNSLKASLGATNTMIMLNRTFGVTAKDIVDISGWQGYTVEQKMNFLKALKEAFGNEEALAAAKAAGMEIIEEVETGINSNADIGKAAGQTAAKNIQSQIDATKYDVSVRVHTYISADVKVGTGGGGGIDRVQSIMSNANGAYDIPRGDVFIANEAGAELVGSINGKTSVANQGQIIEGIAGGVQRANSEQNTLLREQNSLLRRLLEKETSINLGASAGFGRTVRRSLDLYDNLVGG